MSNEQNESIRQAAQTLGALGSGKQKRLSDAERERRREWARGLAKLRAAKCGGKCGATAPEPAKARFVVLDRTGRRWPYWAESVTHAITMARSDGIDAVAGRAEPQEN